MTIFLSAFIDLNSYKVDIWHFGLSYLEKQNINKLAGMSERIDKFKPLSSDAFVSYALSILEIKTHKNIAFQGLERPDFRYRQMIKLFLPANNKIKYAMIFLNDDT